MNQKSINKFKKQTRDLVWQYMTSGNYKRAYEVMEIGRNTIELVSRISQYKPSYLQKEIV